GIVGRRRLDAEPDEEGPLCCEEQVFASVFVLESRPAVVGAQADKTKELLTAREVENLLRIDLKTIYSYFQRGLIAYVRIQSNLRFVKSEVLAWVADIVRVVTIPSGNRMKISLRLLGGFGSNTCLSDQFDVCLMSVFGKHDSARGRLYRLCRLRLIKKKEKGIWPYRLV